MLRAIESVNANFVPAQVKPGLAQQVNLCMKTSVEVAAITTVFDTIYTPTNNTSAPNTKGGNQVLCVIAVLSSNPLGVGPIVLVHHPQTLNRLRTLSEIIIKTFPTKTTQ
jgi:hypothetical protein